MKIIFGINITLLIIFSIVTNLLVLNNITKMCIYTPHKLYTDSGKLFYIGNLTNIENNQLINSNYIYSIKIGESNVGYFNKNQLENNKKYICYYGNNYITEKLSLFEDFRLNSFGIILANYCLLFMLLIILCYKILTEKDKYGYNYLI